MPSHDIYTTDTVTHMQMTNIFTVSSAQVEQTSLSCLSYMSRIISGSVSSPDLIS
jgi:hypothetical protein